MEIIYKGKYNAIAYFNLIDITQDFCIIQTVYPPRPQNYIHRYKNNTFSEDDYIIIYKNDDGEIEVNKCNIN